MSWTEIISQKKVKQILKNSFEQRKLSHAYLFWGIDGIGKDALAIEFAKTLLCKEKTFESCGKCKSCQMMKNLQHPAFKIICATPEIEPSANDKFISEFVEQLKLKSENHYHKFSIQKGKFIRINSIREIYSDALQKYSDYNYRIFLILDADKMNQESANSFLKILEEPNETTIFLLTSSNKDSLLQTIVSRCQLIKCNILTEHEITNALVEKNNLEFEEAKLISKISGGSYLRAQELLSENFKNEREEIISFLRNILISKPTEMTNQIEFFCQNYDRKDFERILPQLQLWLRDAMLLKEGVYEEIVNFDQKDSLERFTIKFKQKKIDDSVNVIDRSLELLKKNVYLPLILYFTSIHLRKIFIYDK